MLIHLARVAHLWKAALQRQISREKGVDTNENVNKEKLNIFAKSQIGTTIDFLTFCNMLSAALIPTGL